MSRKLTAASAFALLGFGSAALAESNPLRDVYFGETHIHTSYSLDAWTFGDRATTPADSYSMKVRRSSPSVTLGWLRCGSAALFLLLSPAVAVACPLCYEYARQLTTEGVQLDMADRAVLATLARGASRFRIVAVIKGKDAVGDIVTDPVTGIDAPAIADRDPCLLIREPVASQWTSLGTMPVEYADWLKQVVATRQIGGERPRRSWPQALQTADAVSYDGWRRRVALIAPHLEDHNPLAARLASGELARAPYAALDAARSKIDGTSVAGWAEDPKLASRRAAYISLLGFIGGPGDAERLERKIDEARNSHDSTNLAAMIGADLELRGPSRVDWVERTYFADRSRTFSEIEAALLALSVHGNANGTVPRGRIIEAYRAFIKEHPAMAGFVAPQLADWGYWGAATEYAALIKSDAIKDPASEFAVQNYLRDAAAAKAGSR